MPKRRPVEPTDFAFCWLIDYYFKLLKRCRQSIPCIIVDRLRTEHPNCCWLCKQKKIAPLRPIKKRRCQNSWGPNKQNIGERMFVFLFSHFLARLNAAVNWNMVVCARSMLLIEKSLPYRTFPYFRAQQSADREIVCSSESMNFEARKLWDYLSGRWLIGPLVYCGQII